MRYDNNEENSCLNIEADGGLKRFSFPLILFIHATCSEIRGEIVKKYSGMNGEILLHE
jgi:hypothetical protein